MIYFLSLRVVKSLQIKLENAVVKLCLCTL